MKWIIRSISTVLLVVFHVCLPVNESQYHICCTSVLQWSCCSSEYRAAKEACCQAPSPLFLPLHCLSLSLPLLHWPEGTVGFLNALPPLWAHIDWLSVPPKAEQHGVPAASFLLVLLKTSLKEERRNKQRKSSGGFTTNLSRYDWSLGVCLSGCEDKQWGSSQFPSVFFSNGGQ